MSPEVILPGHKQVEAKVMKFTEMNMNSLKRLLDPEEKTAKTILNFSRWILETNHLKNYFKKNKWTKENKLHRKDKLKKKYPMFIFLMLLENQFKEHINEKTWSCFQRWIFSWKSRCRIFLTCQYESLWTHITSERWNWTYCNRW